MHFQNKMYFYICLKLHFLSPHFHFTQNEVSTENIENEILLFLVFGLFGKIFSLKMKTKIQPNTFPSPFFYFQ